MTDSIRNNFPQTKVDIHGKRLVYLDSAATTLKAESVIKRLNDFYLYESANVHRGAHKLSDNATGSYEVARETVKSFINANSVEEVVFTRGTTESINLIARTLKSKLKARDKVLLTEMEHHSNIVPWQIISQEIGGLQIEYVTVDKFGNLNLEDLKNKLDDNTKVLSFTACSNVLGTLNPVKEICSLASNAGALSVVDAAQWVAARPTDVKEWNCDFMTFSGHKVFAPFGIGVLYGKLDLLNSLPPFQGGGSMIDQVEYLESSYLNSPFRFEAGTPNVGGAIALAEALSYVNSIGFSAIKEREELLINKTLKAMREINGLRIIGEPRERSNIISFSMEGAHHSDIGTLLDKQGIAIRAGHHCCQLLMKSLGVPGTARIAYSIYSNEEDVEQLIEGLKKVREII